MLNITKETKVIVPRKDLQKIINQANRLYPGLKRQEINLIFISASKIQQLNKKYRKKDQPTDVLSFNYDEKTLLGEIFICPQIAQKQAKIIGHSLRKEIILLFAHGLLHICHLDHKNSTEEKVFNKKLANLLKPQQISQSS